MTDTISEMIWNRHLELSNFNKNEGHRFISYLFYICIYKLFKTQKCLAKSEDNIFF